MSRKKIDHNSILFIQGIIKNIIAIRELFLKYKNWKKNYFINF